MFDTPLELFIALLTAGIVAIIVTYLMLAMFKLAASMKMPVYYLLASSTIPRLLFHLLFIVHVLNPQLHIMTYEHMLGYDPLSNIHSLTVVGMVLFFVSIVSMFKPVQKYRECLKTFAFMALFVTMGFAMAKIVGVAHAMYNTNFVNLLICMALIGLGIEQWVFGSENYLRYWITAALLETTHYLLHLKFMMPEGSIVDMLSVACFLIFLYGIASGTKFWVEPTHDYVMPRRLIRSTLLGIFSGNGDRMDQMNMIKDKKHS
ncbi:MAG: hypothetical protein QMC78_05790 [Methanocellales archaeon]|nr:hypothetical protein [Methanocellales archaeon]